jgi:hypothetical protein
MADPKQQRSERRSANETPKPETMKPKRAEKADLTPGESIEGEGSPGLSILGGGGHA